MRRFFTISFMLLALAVSAAGVAPAAHAAGTASEGQTCDPTDTTEGGSAVCESGLVCTTDSGRNTCQNPPTQQPVDPRAAAAAAKNPLEQGQAESTRFGLNYVMQMIAGLFAWLVGAAALTLNFSMYYTVVNMGGYITNLPAIRTVWEILRDIGNILLIFGFLAIGISIIIDSDWYGGGQKLLPKLIIVAVFANFSLFAAEAVIDVGNLFATQIYRQINGGKVVAPMGATDAFFAVINKEGVAGVLMNKLGLASIYGEVLGKDKDGNNLVTSTGPWYMGFMSSIVFLVVAFVMFTLAFVLISRFIVLILLIMVSPVGVVGLAVPGLQGWANKWWDTLFHQTITAPILLLMLYIALSVIVDDGFLGFGTTTPAWGGTQTGYIMQFAGTLLSYLIAMGLLLAVVYFAKTLSAVGAGWATKTAGKLSFGATALGMRSTVGWGSQRLSRAVRSSERLRGTKTGRMLATTFDKGAKASFDVRGTSALKNIPGGGIDAGAAQKGGYRQRVENSTKAHEAYAKSIEDREPTRSEQQQIDVATVNRIGAEKLHKEASGEHELTETETIKLRAEVKRLENLSIKSPETDRALGAAQQKLATSETSLAAATTKLAEATGKLKEDKKAETKIKAEVEAKTSAKAGREKYVESIQGTRSARFSSLAMFGPGGTAAAKKIKTSKPTKDQLADLLKKMQKEEDEANKGEDKDKDKGEDNGGGKKDEKGEKKA